MDKLKSRKLWVSVVAAILVVIGDELGLPIEEETLVAFAAIVVAYVTGQAIVDRQKAKTSTDRASPLTQAPSKAEPNTDELHQG